MARARRFAGGFGPVSERERRRADRFFAELVGARVPGRRRAAPAEREPTEDTVCPPAGPTPQRCTGLRAVELLDCFDHGSHAVLPRHEPVITNLALCIVASHLTASPITQVYVVGHTDATGSSAENLALGQRRADAVRTALQGRLRTLTRGRPPAVTISTFSEGERRPLGTGRHGPSRRVEVGSAAAFPRPPSLPACQCDLGLEGEELRARLADTIDRGLVTTSPHERQPQFAATGPTGIFAGDYDYHSAVHGQWARLSLARISGDAARTTASLGQLTDASLASERGFLQASTSGFEQPYGRAWLVLLLSEVAAQPGRDTAALQGLRRTAEQELLTWLETNRAAANDAAVGRHGSWLLALLLLQMSAPILAGATARIDALYGAEVATHRATWRARPSARDDFLHVPSIIDTLDLLRGQPAQRTLASMPASRVATISPGHEVGEELTRLWPVAILARTDPAMCTLLRDRLREWLGNPRHWEHTATTPTSQFESNSHWTPQFLWMAMKLRC